jgi:hypothetical protein
MARPEAPRGAPRKPGTGQRRDDRLLLAQLVTRAIRMYDKLRPEERQGIRAIRPAAQLARPGAEPQRSVGQDARLAGLRRSPG